MIPNIFILDSGGEVIIEKHFMPGFKRSVCDVFWEEAAKFDVKENVRCHAFYCSVNVHAIPRFCALTC